MKLSVRNEREGGQVHRVLITGGDGEGLMGWSLEEESLG